MNVHTYIEHFCYNIMNNTNSQEKTNQIPTESGPQGKTGKCISEQNAIEGMRKEVAVEDYSLVADIGQILKDLDFPAEKTKIIEFVKQKSGYSKNKDKILLELDKLEEKSYKNVSDVTMSAGLVY